jgi:predicted amidophosphoribosyltransferase
MAFMTKEKCSICGKEFKFWYNDPRCICPDCIKIQEDKDMSKVLLYLNSHPQVTIVTIRNFLLQNKDFIEFVKTQMV